MYRSAGLALAPNRTLKRPPDCRIGVGLTLPAALPVATVHVHCPCWPMRPTCSAKPAFIGAPSRATKRATALPLHCCVQDVESVLFERGNASDAWATVGGRLRTCSFNKWELQPLPALPPLPLCCLPTCSAGACSP